MSAELWELYFNYPVQKGLGFSSFLLFHLFIIPIISIVSRSSGFLQPLLLTSYISPPFVSPFLFLARRLGEDGCSSGRRKLMRK